jgi:4-diphosphocytidyl-2-C-methyl-D-erythritol kinase
VKVVVSCPAKVNLHLEVLGRRPDGYHELRTVFAAVGLWDELALEVAPPGVFELSVVPAGAAPAGAENLAVRAVRALAATAGGAHGARVTLRKAIPAGGGLGGGSADAAAALVGAASLWKTDLDPRALVELAAALGADVPFFLVGGAAWGVGRGSVVAPLPDLPAWWVVLLPGPTAIATAEVYRAFDAGGLDGDADCAIYQWVVSGGDLPVGRCRNDLQPTVAQRWPEVAERLARVRATGPMLAMLSGSGGTVFGLYRDEPDARRAARALAAAGPLVAPVLGREASRLRASEGRE